MKIGQQRSQFASVFSEAPYGAVWICGHCDRIHVRFGDCILMFPPEMLAHWADADNVRGALCDDCESLHLIGAHGHLDIPREYLAGFLKAAAVLLAQTQVPVFSHRRIAESAALRH
jgi:hypothetical protein